MWQKVEIELKKTLGNSFEIFSASKLTGGDINEVYRLITSTGSLCIKMNKADSYPQMFQKEALGLERLKQHTSFTIPVVICTGDVEDYSYLLLSFIDSSNKKPDYWNNFGERLADMHKTAHNQFGLEHNNYIGSLHQPNEERGSWVDFFYHNRILSQIELGIEKGIFTSDDAKNANELYHRLNSIIPTEKPSLLHGDLWSGNVMVDEKGNPALIDPAVYYGHREMDLAMTKLFGGFDHSMYEAYHSTFPLEKNWEDRFEIHNLYPILVHANLFGGNYIQQVRGILHKYS